MVNTIVRIIEKACDSSLEEGREKYSAYFVEKSKYEKYRAEVDAKLITEGYAEVIIE